MKGATAVTPRKKIKGENIKPRLFGIIGTNEEKTREQLTKQIQEALYKTSINALC